MLMLSGCATSPYERGGNPQGLTQRDVERDYMECEYKARLSNPQHFYNQGSPFPFSGGRNVSMSLGHLPLAFSVEPRLSES
ncbi:MAG: hypothetical protein JW395_1262 [Nitrospira sp.]|nr:hypothetical protein [Nitrospira sp.]